MYWLPEIFGAEIFWMAILLIHIKTERFRDWPKTRTMGMRVAAVWISCQKIFGTENFLDGDSIESYKSCLLAISARARTIGSETEATDPDTEAMRLRCGAISAQIASETEAIDPDIDAIRLRCGADTTRIGSETEAIDPDTEAMRLR